MKKQLLILFVCILTKTSFSQPVTNNPANGGANSGQFWSRQGNNFANGTNNVFGFQTSFNSQIWHQTNGFNRMLMNNGTNAVTDGRVGIGNNLPTNFNPQARLHLYQLGTGGGPIYNMFRKEYILIGI